MNPPVPEWLIKLLWFIASVYATGALWFAISNRNYSFAAVTICMTIILIFVAIQLHRVNDRSVRFKKQREQLADYIKEAGTLQSRNAEVPLPIQDHNDWVERVETYLRDNLDMSYAIRLSDFSGMTFYSGGNSDQSKYRNSLIGRTTRLHEFIRELQ